jgi:flagellin-like hook-associated protein FlgL
MVKDQVGPSPSTVAELYAVIRQQLHSGHRVTRISQAPSAAAAVMALRAELGNHVTVTRALHDGSRWTELTLRSLRKAQDLLNQLSPGSEKAKFAKSREQLLEIANTRLDGRPIFAGTGTAAKAYAVDGSYLGNHTAMVRTANLDGSVLNVSMIGPEVFGDGRESVLTHLASLSGRMILWRNAWRHFERSRERVAEALRRADDNARDLAAHSVRMRELSDTHGHRLSRAEDIDPAATFALVRSQESNLLDALTLRPPTTLNSLSEFLQ